MGTAAMVATTAMAGTVAMAEMAVPVAMQPAAASTWAPAWSTIIATVFSNNTLATAAPGGAVGAGGAAGDVAKTYHETRRPSLAARGTSVASATPVRALEPPAESQARTAWSVSPGLPATPAPPRARMAMTYLTPETAASSSQEDGSSFGNGSQRRELAFLRSELFSLIQLPLLLALCTYELYGTTSHSRS